MDCSSCEYRCQCCEFGIFEYGGGPCYHCEDIDSTFELMGHIHFCPVTGKEMD